MHISTNKIYFIFSNALEGSKRKTNFEESSPGTVEKSEELWGGNERTMTVVEDWKTPEYSVPGNARKREENVGIRAIFHPLTER